MRNISRKEELNLTINKKSVINSILESTPVNSRHLVETATLNNEVCVVIPQVIEFNDFDNLKEQDK